MDKIRSEIVQLNNELEEAFAEVVNVNLELKLDLINEKLSNQLLGGISSIRHSNRLFQQDLQQVTQNIVKFHNLKKNLSNCIDFLTNYQKFVHQSNILTNIVLLKQYSTIPPVIKELNKLTSYFSTHSEISFIKTVLQKIEYDKMELQKSIIHDSQVRLLDSNCFQCIENLDPSFKEEFLQSIIQQELVDYSSLFRMNDKTFSYQGIISRINWFIKTFVDIQETYYKNIPLTWNFNQHIATRFVFMLKRDILCILQNSKTSKQTITVTDAAKCCLQFEEKLQSLFPQCKWKNTLLGLFDEYILSEFTKNAESELKAMFKDLNLEQVKEFSSTCTNTAFNSNPFSQSKSILESATVVCLATKQLIYSCVEMSSKQTFAATIYLIQKYYRKYMHLVIHDCNQNVYIRVNTLNYCIEMIKQLRDISIKSVDNSCKSSISFEELISFSYEKLNYLLFCIVRKFATQAEQHFQSLKVLWQSTNQAEDCMLVSQSLSSLVIETLKEAECNLSIRCDFYQVFDKMAEFCAEKYLSFLLSLHIPTVNAELLSGEQLLLSFQILSESFLRSRPGLVILKFVQITKICKCLIAPSDYLKEMFANYFPEESPPISFNAVLEIRGLSVKDIEK